MPEPIPEREEPIRAPAARQTPERREAPAQASGAHTAPSPPRRNYPSSPRNSPPPRSQGQYSNSQGSVGNFLKGLLPQNFDTEDLIVVLLLLLMSGNSGGGQNAALTTLVIYLFL